MASFLLGTPSSGSVDKNVAPAFQSVYYGAYPQDDFHVSPKLTLNLGIRWEYEAPRTESYNQMTRGFAYKTPSPLQSRVPNLTFPCSAVCFSLMSTDNREARPTPSGRTSRHALDRLPDPSKGSPAHRLRCLFADTTTTGRGTASSPGFSVATPMVTSVDGITPQDLLRNPFPNGLLEPIGSSQGLLTLVGQGVSFTEVTRPITYSQQYSLGFSSNLCAIY